MVFQWSTPFTNITEFTYPIELNNLVCFAISTMCYNDDIYSESVSARYPKNVSLTRLTITFGSTTKNAAFVIGI